MKVKLFASLGLLSLLVVFVISALLQTAAAASGFQRSKLFQRELRERHPNVRIVD
jgi:hypothetical protein